AESACWQVNALALVYQSVAHRRTGRVDQRTLLVILRAVPVSRPLPHIAEHVVQSVGIGLLLCHFMNGGSTVGSRPCNRIEFAVSNRSCAPARGILPFGFGRQSSAGPFAESVRFIPDHCHDGIPASFLSGRHGYALCFGKPLKGSYGDLRLRDPETIADLNGV